jgi:hypothetical protein
MINFIDLVPGNRFIHGNKSYMKIGAEVCDFNNLGAGFDLRLNIEAEDGRPEVGRVAIVYNSVDLNTGQLRSFQSEDLVEADKEVDLQTTLKTPETPDFGTDTDDSYTF